MRELGRQKAELVKGQGHLQALVEKYTGLYHAAPVGVVTLDRRGMILASNQTGASLVGIPLARIVGKSLIKWMPFKSQAEFIRFLKLALRLLLPSIERSIT